MKTIFILLLSIISLFAHPHTFIDVYPTITVKNSSTSTINFKWVLDDMSSSMLMMDVDKNGDGVINRSENSTMYKEYFTIFEDYDYYTYIKVDKKTIKFPEVENFKATIEKHRICYSFDITIKTDIKNTVFEFGDSDFYIAMVLKDDFVEAKGLDVKVIGVDNDFYYGYRLELN